MHQGKCEMLLKILLLLGWIRRSYGTSQVIIYIYHRAVQPHIAIIWLPRTPDCSYSLPLCLKKQLAKADHFTLVDRGSEIWFLCKKSNFLSWVIRPLFTNPVTVILSESIVLPDLLSSDHVVIIQAKSVVSWPSW